MKKILIATILAGLTGCGDNYPDFPFPEPEPQPTEVATPIPTSSPSPTPEPEPLPDPILVNPRCPTEPMKPGECFRWKSRSESDGNLVVILPPEFTEIFDSVRVNGIAGRSTGWGNWCGAPHRLRQHWRFDRPGGKFPREVLVVAKEDGNTCKWWVKQ